MKTLDELFKELHVEYEALGQKHNMTGDEFWLEAEGALKTVEDYEIIMRLRRQIAMCDYLKKRSQKQRS